LAHTAESFQQEVIAESGDEQVSIEALHEELQSIRAEGYTVDRGQSHENIWAVAAPVMIGGELHGALMISTVLHRFDEQRGKDELRRLLLQTVKEIEHRLSRYDFDDIYANW
jgi:DNA-binding IclR family transcriptional regulator